MTKPIDIFLSYKREKCDLVESVQKALITQGFTVVTDLNITRNQDFGDAIDILIRTARMTIDISF